VSVYVLSFSSGDNRARFNFSKDEGMVNGCFCGGMLEGNGGSWVGVGRVLRGRSRSGSSPFLNDVYTFGRSDMLS
jgi:hypothetical protein